MLQLLSSPYMERCLKWEIRLTFFVSDEEEEVDWTFSGISPHLWFLSKMELWNTLFRCCEWRDGRLGVCQSGNQILLHTGTPGQWNVRIYPSSQPDHPQWSRNIRSDQRHGRSYLQRIWSHIGLKKNSPFFSFFLNFGGEIIMSLTYR